MPPAADREQEEGPSPRPQTLDGVEDAPSGIPLGAGAEVGLSTL